MVELLAILSIICPYSSSRFSLDFKNILVTLKIRKFLQVLFFPLLKIALYKYLFSNQLRYISFYFPLLSCYPFFHKFHFDLRSSTEKLLHTLIVVVVVVIPAVVALVAVVSGRVKDGVAGRVFNCRDN